MLVLVRDGWLPDGYFDDKEWELAQAAANYNNTHYVGHWTVRKCSEDHPKRFEAATIGPKALETRK